jgi:putative membrane protein
MRFLIHVVANGAAILLAAYLVPGIHVASGATVIIAGFALAIVNALVKPILTIITLPLTFLTLGLFLFVLNAACLGLAAALVRGFSIDGFWPALIASLVISVVSWVLTGLLSSSD